LEKRAHPKFVATIRYVARIFSLMSVVAALAITACGSQATRRASHPPPVTEPQSEASPEQVQEETYPELVAPPPAYGNKIVMAGRNTPGSNN
jgi:hypothetical protein